MSNSSTVGYYYIVMKIKTGVYEHFKGKRYRVLGVAKHSETLEDFVVYRALYDNEVSKLWVRPVEIFKDTVELNGKKVLRYKYIGGRI